MSSRNMRDELLVSIGIKAKDMVLKRDIVADNDSIRKFAVNFINQWYGSIVESGYGFDTEVELELKKKFGVKDHEVEVQNMTVSDLRKIIDTL